MKHEIKKVSPEDLIHFGDAWSDLGWAVQEQVRTVLDGADTPENVNPNAIKLAVEELEQYPSIVEPLQAWLAKQEEE